MHRHVPLAPANVPTEPTIFDVPGDAERIDRKFQARASHLDAGSEAAPPLITDEGTEAAVLFFNLDEAPMERGPSLHLVFPGADGGGAGDGGFGGGLRRCTPREGAGEEEEKEGKEPADTHHVPG